MAASSSSSDIPINSSGDINLGMRISNSRSTPPNPTTPTDTTPPMVFLTLPVHTKFSRTNFLAWKSQIEPLLHAYGLSSFLTDPPSSSTSIDPLTGQAQLDSTFLAWYKQDQMILALLRASLSEQILAQVVSCSTSGDLWRYLTHTFSSSSRALLTDLKKKLQNSTKGGASCTDFINQIRAISDELAFIGA
ncbi:Copia protein [Rhynchospora pubera]|uniref:Copia protein n=1 Tax=Rhynchospora pubera TaxID=906938 RepID=A0AAV8ERC5_9POAL|nr:Copia protein [Rhynchospora pubera]